MEDIKRFSIEKFYNNMKCGVEAIDEVLYETYKRLDGKEFIYKEYDESKSRQRENGYYLVKELSGSLRHFRAKRNWLI